MKTTTSAILRGKQAVSFIEYLNQQGVKVIDNSGERFDLERTYSVEALLTFENDPAITAVCFNLDLGGYAPSEECRYDWSIKIYRDGSFQLDDFIK